MRRSTLLILSLFLVNIYASQAGGGWTHAKGTGYVKVGQWWVIADKHYDSNGQTVPNINAGVLNTVLYGEYGITDRLEALLYFPVVSHAFQDITPDYRQTVTSVGDTDLGIKYAILKSTPVVLSSYLWLGLPFGESNGGIPSDLQTGDGEFNQVIGLVGSSGGDISDKVNVYGSLGFDFNHRGGDLSDEWSWKADVGVMLFKKVVISYKLTNLKSLNNGAENTENPIGGIFSNNREYFAYTYEIGVNLDEHIGVTGTYSSVYSAKNIFANPAYSVGVYFNF